MIKEYRCWRCGKIITKLYNQGMCFNCYAEKTNSAEENGMKHCPECKKELQWWEGYYCDKCYEIKIKEPSFIQGFLNWMGNI